jgi:hypothetical protein
MPLKDFTTKYFLNREHELEAMEGIAAETGHGDAGSILLAGRRGTGKTELLKQLYIRLFNNQNDAIPFFYVVKTAFFSAADFSRDYLRNFILQSLAFINKDMSLLNSDIYSFEDLIYIAHKNETQWVIDIIDKYLQYQTEDKQSKMFLHAISAPYSCYRKSGIQVVVLIDDFYKLNKFCELYSKDDCNNFWSLLETAISSKSTPHVIAGSQSELQKIFFDEMTLGYDLELINLDGLDRQESMKLFNMFSKIYGVEADIELSRYIHIFSGNPFYIKSFIQAARQRGKTFSEEEFWQIYVNDVIEGKVFTYWASLLKTYIPKFELRKPALKFLYHLCNGNSEVDFSALSETIEVSRDDLDHVIDLLETAGTVEAGFTTLGLAEDEIMADVIRGLYLRELSREPIENIKNYILANKRQYITASEKPSFDMSIPAVPKAELVAVKSLEQAAQYYNVPTELIGRIQIALIVMFNNMLARFDASSAGQYRLKFLREENTVSIEITTSLANIEFTDSEKDQLRAYLDDVRIERVISGTRITLIKEISKNLPFSA